MSISESSISRKDVQANRFSACLFACAFSVTFRTCSGVFTWPYATRPCLSPFDLFQLLSFLFSFSSLLEIRSSATSCMTLAFLSLYYVHPYPKEIPDSLNLNYFILHVSNCASCLLFFFLSLQSECCHLSVRTLVCLPPPLSVTPRLPRPSHHLQKN